MCFSLDRKSKSEDEEKPGEESKAEEEEGETNLGFQDEDRRTQL